MKKQHINLIIATPGHSVGNYYLKSLFKTVEILGEKKITWAWVNDTSSNVADAREATISGTRINNLEQTEPLNGEITYDKIIWIDSDISWEPEDVIKLYESDKDIVTGAYLLATGEVTVYPKMLDRAMFYEEFLEKKEPFKVDGAGFGFVCIKNGIFEKMSRPWFQSAGITHTQNGKTFNFNILGEDLSWFSRARELGFEVWVDPDVKVIHNKTMRLTWEGPRP
jgi:hypothetical protein